MSSSSSWSLRIGFLDGESLDGLTEALTGDEKAAGLDLAGEDVLIGEVFPRIGEEGLGGGT